MEDNLTALTPMAKIRRRRKVKDAQGWTGIDYINVDSVDDANDTATLSMHFISGKATPAIPAIHAENISISGAERSGATSGISVTKVQKKDSKNAFTVTLDLSGLDKSESKLDHSYLLNLSGVSGSVEIDPLFSIASFSLQGKSIFDPVPVTAAQPKPKSDLKIDYLSKDYKSFRRLMTDRLSALLPDSKEKNPADLKAALTEVAAYMADYLSYYQDAVATEAYLGTARRRVSVKRHARLLDYFMHEGCNARVWVHFQTKGDVALKKGVKLTTKAQNFPCIVKSDVFKSEPVFRQTQIFETMHEANLYEKHNGMSFYTWENNVTKLVKGATKATLKGKFDKLSQGDVLIFEEIKGLATGEKLDADMNKRQAVRLTRVLADNDPVAKNEKNITIIEWAKEDALLFDFHLKGGTENSVSDITVARGNIVLADHGRTINDESPPKVGESGAYRPSLEHSDITYRTPYDHGRAKNMSAKKTLLQKSSRAFPEIRVKNSATGEEWKGKNDLLDSDGFTKAFALEITNDRKVFLRFGNGKLGKRPAAGTEFKAEYRVGTGLKGNVGREAVSHVVADVVDDEEMDIIGLRNPMSARGGMDPEDMEAVRLHSPAAFHSQKRCITLEDYVERIESHPEVGKAGGALVWTGSWHTFFITVFRHDGAAVDAGFCRELKKYMEEFRTLGSHMEILPPVYKALDIALDVTMSRGHFKSTVEHALLEAFSNMDLKSGKRGYFHPDDLTFGRDVYASDILAHAMKIPGVEDAQITKFSRWGDAAGTVGEIISIKPLEIARVDNNIKAPENGIMKFDIKQ